MSTYTPNYNLEKPDVEEFYDVTVPNGNMEKIDTNLKEISDVINEHLIETPTKSKAGHVKLQEDYISGALQNGWQGSFLYAKNDLNIVSIRLSAFGTATSGGTVIATLPLNYRPKTATVLPVVTDIENGIKTLIIRSGGEIIIPTDATLEVNRIYLASAIFYGGE